ncbi:hypothetical protein GLGCALEP_01321 [Pseudomonas sp. MM221]|nr:hypothetical protein DBADOPDK_01285 [Pseudomonas sp. MM223]CAI3795907.1 hypothetical protein GLGCALEP_01321 [Pseudomonas sp. MM221]
MKQRQHGFTLLEVTVALAIAAVLAVITSQVLRQRLAVQDNLQQHRLGLLCARELQTRFAVEQFWPYANQVKGELSQGGSRAIGNCNCAVPACETCAAANCNCTPTATSVCHWASTPCFWSAHEKLANPPRTR